MAVDARVIIIQETAKAINEPFNAVYDAVRHIQPLDLFKTFIFVALADGLEAATAYLDTPVKELMAKGELITSADVEALSTAINALTNPNKGS